MDGAHTPPPGASARHWRGFRRWRRARPFAGGHLLVLSGLELLLSSNLDLGNLQMHVGQTGFLSYLLPAAMVLCGALVWATPQHRLFYGIIGSLVAVYALVGLNIGGFLVGTVLGIVGGALAIAWGPPRTPPAPVTGQDEDTVEETVDPADDNAENPADPSDDDAEEQRQRDSRPIWFGAVVIPVAIAVVLLGAGVHAAPARAAPAPSASCPTARATEPAGSATTRPVGRPTPKPGPKAAKPAGRPVAIPGPTATATATATPTAPDGPGDPLADAWNDFTQGVEKFFNPSATPRSTPGPTGDPTGAPTPGPTGDPTAGPAPAAGGPVRTPSASATPRPAARRTLAPVPCLGPRVDRRAARAPGQPTAALRPALLTTPSLTMDDSVYDGVVDLPTAAGPLRVLRFTMDKAVNTPFRLQVAEQGDNRTVVTSTELTTEGDVVFFTPRMEGKLFGLFPVTFTPASPPPLTLPKLWFTDVSIDLAFINCRTLTAKTMKIAVH